MKKSNALNLIGGILLIALGVLFLGFLQFTATEVVTDAIFMGAGALLLRRAYLSKGGAAEEEGSRSKVALKSASKRDAQNLISSKGKPMQGNQTKMSKRKNGSNRAKPAEGA